MTSSRVSSPVAGLPGIPRFSYQAMKDFLRYAAGARKMVNGLEMEFCGLFVSMPEDWHPVGGWNSNLHWVTIPNLATVHSTTEMDMKAVTDVLNGVARNTRAIIHLRLSEHGLSADDPWEEVLHRKAELSSVDSSYLIDEVIANTGDRFVGADVLEYIQESLVSPILGFGHTHPNGVAEVSPQDLIGAARVNECNAIFNEVSLGRASTGANLSGLFGNWVAVLDERHAVSDLLRFDERGRTGKWSGDFTS